MSRERLPDRRRQVTDRLVWPPNSGRVIDVSVGFDSKGRALEVFARLECPGSDLDAALDDASIAISRGLQFGDTLADLAIALCRPDPRGNSVLAAVVDLAAKIEREGVR